MGVRLNPQISPCFSSGFSEADKERAVGMRGRLHGACRGPDVEKPESWLVKGRLELLRQCRVGSSKTEPFMGRKPVCKAQTGEQGLEKPD